MAPEVLDAPSTDSPDLGTDTSIDASVDTTSSTDAPSTDTTTADAAPSTDTTDTADVSDGAIVEDGKLTVAGNKILRDLQAKAPQAAAQLKRAVLERESMRQMFPGGLREAATIQKLVKDAGGPEGMAKRNQELSFFMDLDEAFTKGDQKFVDELTGPDTVDAFKAIAPKIIDRYLQIEPEASAVLVSQALEGFQQSHPNEEAAYVCGRIQGHMMAPLEELGGRSFVTVLNLMNELPADSPRQAELRGMITKFVNGIFATARQPFKVQPKAAPAPAKDDGREKQLTEREQKLAKQETDAVRSDWRKSAWESQNAIYSAELGRLSKGIALSEQKKSAIETLAIRNFERTLAKDPRFNETLESYFSSKNREAYLKFIKQYQQEHLTKAVRAAFDAVVERPKTAAPKPAPAPKPGANGDPRPSARPAPPAGYEHVATRPATTDIDLSRTTQAMIAEGKAFLKGGRRIAWR